MICFPQIDSLISVCVVLAGDAPTGKAAKTLQEAARKGAALICADGGADRLFAMELKPALILGDCDSIQGDMGDIPHVDYPTAKDFTDGQAAIAYALSHYEGSVAVFCASGGRIDMFLSNLLLVGGLDADIQRLQIYDNNTEIGYCTKSCTVGGAVGDRISLIPLTPVVKDVFLVGMEYPLNGEDAVFGESRLISNALVGDMGWVALSEGKLLVLHEYGTKVKKEQK